MAVALEHSLLHGKTFAAIVPYCAIVRLCVNSNYESDRPLVCCQRFFVQKKSSVDDNLKDEENTWI